MKTPQRHVVLLSGGADSATVLAIANEKVRAQRKAGIDSEIIAFHCNYGQRTQERELASFTDLCDHYGVDYRYVIDIHHLKQIGNSSLTDDEIDVDVAGDALRRPITATSYVPFRNGNLLSIAASIASVHRATEIWCGVVAQDETGYPDCRIEFIKNMEVAINCGLQDGVDICLRTPLIGMQKREIIKHGIELKVPYRLTWSCYKESERACGVCDSCRLRVRSFDENSSVDPIEYLIPWEKAVEISREHLE